MSPQMAAASPEPIRLTNLIPGGDCGYQIAPGVRQEALNGLTLGFPHPDLLVGGTTAEEAAVYRLNEHQVLVATTDLFRPIVDDPIDFGRIAATNALSDVYAMGATPILALAIVGLPINILPLEVIRRIMQGGADVCRQAGIPLTGGHAIDFPEPIYGLAVMGLATPRAIKRNDTAQAGDLLILGKPLGVGILSAALKTGRLGAEGYAEMLATTTQLNHIGTCLGGMKGVHAMTDVTGFGLLGQLLEICRGSRLAARIHYEPIPKLGTALPFLEQGIGPGAIERNWASYGQEVGLSPELPPSAQRLLCDPQTSGGLLVACGPERVTDLVQLFHDEGFGQAAVIGRMEAGVVKTWVE